MHKDRFHKPNGLKPNLTRPDPSPKPQTRWDPKPKYSEPVTAQKWVIARNITSSVKSSTEDWAASSALPTRLDRSSSCVLITGWLRSLLVAGLPVALRTRLSMLLIRAKVALAAWAMLSTTVTHGAVESVIKSTFLYLGQGWCNCWHGCLQTKGA